MPTFNETGHTKNVANFAELISFVTSYGNNYNPSKISIQIPNLQDKLTIAQEAINKVNITNTQFNNSVNTRIILFKNYKPYSTRIINALIATDATNQTIADAKTINKKIQGQRAKAIEIPTDPNTPAPKTISTSQQSYDQKIQHLDILINILKLEPSYTPNEPDLQIKFIENYKTELLKSNNNVTTDYTTVSNL